MATKPCPVVLVVKEAWEDDITCGRPKKKGTNKCVWHWLDAQPIELQINSARYRRKIEEEAPDFEYRARVPERDWPEGERWCSGCQRFIPLFYCTGSQCKAHASLGAHTSHLQNTYMVFQGGVLRPFTREDYEALYVAQKGVCYLCGRRSVARRLAVDHDHLSLTVRGLLCPDIERGCNKAVIGNIEAAAQDSPLAMARRIVQYLEEPPAAKLWSREPAAPVAPQRNLVNELPDWARP